jgi:hypothetical protein
MELIEWLDHSSYDRTGWRDLDRLLELTPYKVQSVGWVVKDAKDHLIIAGHRSVDQTSYTGEMCILKKDITKRKKIKGV